MSSSSYANPRTNPELTSLYEISMLPPLGQFQEYFMGAMTILSHHFPVSYAAILLRDTKKDSLHVEALYGMEWDAHPHPGPCEKGIIDQVLRSRQPMPILNFSQEPFYDEASKTPKPMHKIQAPLLCIPLIIENESIGVMNINPLYGSRDEFAEDFHFLSILSAILYPVVNNHHLKKTEHHDGAIKTKKTSLLEEILQERLTEVLNKIDPYVESKSRTGLLDDIVSLVEKILIKSAMERVGYVQTSAAQLLGINRNTLRTKIKEMKIKFR